MTEIGIGLMVFGVAMGIVGFGNAWDRWQEARKVLREREAVARAMMRELDNYWMRDDA